MQTVTFPGKFESLAKISAFITEAARKAGLSDSAVYAVELAVDEACSNIIDHAYGGEGIGDIECSVEILKDGLKITLQDHGSPFDPAEVPSPKLDLPLEDLKRRGVGLFLMRKMMDEVRYETAPEGGNRWILVKRKTS